MFIVIDNPPFAPVSYEIDTPAGVYTPSPALLAAATRQP